MSGGKFEKVETTRPEYLDGLRVQADAVSKATRALWRLTDDLWTYSLAAEIKDDNDEIVKQPALIGETISVLMQQAGAVMETSRKLEHLLSFVKPSEEG